MKKALYRYPAEWEPQEATWLAFPHNKKNWYGERGEKIRWFYVELIRLISEFQPVNVLVPSKQASASFGWTSSVWANIAMCRC